MVRNYILLFLFFTALAVTSGCRSAARQQQVYSPAPIDYTEAVSTGASTAASTGGCPSCH